MLLDSWVTCTLHAWRAGSFVFACRGTGSLLLLTSPPRSAPWTCSWYLSLVNCYFLLFFNLMLAVQLSGVNQLAIVDVPEPNIGGGEVLVSIRAAALNHRDVWIKSGQYAGLKWPCIPGSDGAGEVIAVGAGVDASWVKREVIINPSFGWGERTDAQGPEFSILGLPRQGTLAEKIAVPATQVSAKPAHLTWEEAAALPLGGLTAFRALFARA